MDKNVEKVITQLRSREEQGMSKYGVNTERSDLSTLEWLQHLQEELMDASVYIEKLKNEMKETRVVMGVCFGERGEKDFDNSAIQYHGKTKNYKKQQPEDDWENEGGVTLPDVDDNTPREELDAWTVKYHRKITRLKTTAKATAKGTAAKEDNWKKRYKGYREWKKKIPMKDLARLEEEYNMKGNDE